jgi:hypothetical protein
VLGSRNTCLHRGSWQPRVLKEVDLSAENSTVDEQPTQPVQGTQAASLLVSMAKSSV